MSKTGNETEGAFFYEEFVFGELVPEDLKTEVGVVTYIPQRWGMYVPVRPGRERRLPSALRRLGRRKGYAVGGVHVDSPDRLRYPKHYAVSWMAVPCGDLTSGQCG